ncbi:hypothetical protein K9N68_09845 [Kovacikia minuta CCNUW1]|uniref:hypothetical protein n=1 Tax=Kovacikia minuta TaxID=2931930 RepID=UPI001CCF6AFC|nr:hypothetical protein [Kovacikia minuta]UBF28152.1 hypothetical protein K9N68_09845 [Kovacikia minuta CCNUW1]
MESRIAASNWHKCIHISDLPTQVTGCTIALLMQSQVSVAAKAWGNRSQALIRVFVSTQSKAHKVNGDFTW